MSKVIPKEKTKELTSVINSLGLKHPHLNTPKCSFLLGAGSSFACKIPLGSTITEICRQIVFAGNDPKGAPVFNKVLNAQSGISEDDLKKFIEDNKAAYQKFVKNTEKEFVRELDAKEKNDLLKTIPKRISNAQPDKNQLWKDYKDLFLQDALYGKWFELYNSKPSERQLLIEKLMKDAEPNGAYILLAFLIDDGLVKDIYTTNFDNLLYDAVMSYTNKRPRLFAHNETAAFLNIFDQRPNIIKLHGDFLFQDMKNTNSETKTLENNMHSKLSEALLQHDLLVIGYNGADYSIMDALQTIKENSNQPFNLYWCKRPDDNLHWRAEELILNTANSYLVEIPSFNGFIVNLHKIYGKTENPTTRMEETAKRKKEDMDNYLKEYNIQIQEDENITPEDKEDFEKKVDVWDLIREASAETDFAKRIPILEKAIKIDPINSIAYNNLGHAQNETGKYEEAYINCTKAIELNPKNDYAYTNRGLVLIKLKKYEEGIIECNKAIEINPKNEYAYSNRGNALINLEKYEEAIIDCTKSIEINPKHKYGYSNRAFALKNLERYEDALIDFSKYIELSPEEEEETYISRGIVLINLGKYEDAKADLKIALKIDPNSITAPWHLAKVYLHEGNKEKAYELIESALEKGYEYPFNNTKYHNLTPLFEEERFKELVEKYKKKED